MDSDQVRRDRAGGHRRPAGIHGHPRPRARAGPGQRHRRRLRRHPVIGFAPLATDSRPGATSCARRSPSGASSDRPTSQPSPFTSWPTQHSRARRTTSTAASSSSRD